MIWWICPRKRDNTKCSGVYYRFDNDRKLLDVTISRPYHNGYMRIDGWTRLLITSLLVLQIKILLAQVGSLKNNNLDEQSLQEVIIDIVTSALRSTCVNFNLNQYHGCPRLVRKPPAPAQYLPLHYDSMVSTRTSMWRRNRFFFGHAELVTSTTEMLRRLKIEWTRYRT